MGQCLSDRLCSICESGLIDHKKYILSADRHGFVADHLVALIHVVFQNCVGQSWYSVLLVKLYKVVFNPIE